MKVRCDVYLGDENRIDLSFLEKRETWLPNTGIYLEFILKGVYHEKVDFKVEGEKNKVLVSRYSWNRFFLNLKDSGEVTFSVLLGDEVLVEKKLQFNVAHLHVPLAMSVPNLLVHPVSDIRYFANRLSENLVNLTRFTLFTPGFLEKLSDGVPTKEFYKYYEMLFAILTERGITLVVSPYGDIVYALDFIKEAGKDILWEFVERGKRYNIVWDFTSGLRQKELGGLLDSVWNKFREDVVYSVFPTMVDRIGGEGFSYIFQEYSIKDIPPQNDRGIKVARLNKLPPSFYSVRSFSKRAVESGWGVELVTEVPFRQLRNFKYSLCKAMVRGYFDAGE